MNQLRMEISRPSAKGDETSPWFWNPGRIGVKLGPEWFREKLHEVDPDLEVTWNREDERWIIWFRKPTIQHRLCQGWLLLFIVQTPDGEYVPLDERTLAKVYEVSARKHGNAKQYFDAIVREQERDKEARERADNDDTWQRAGEYYDFTLPKVGYGPISPSKVVGQ